MFSSSIFSENATFFSGKKVREYKISSLLKNTFPKGQRCGIFHLTILHFPEDFV